MEAVGRRAADGSRQGQVAHGLADDVEPVAGGSHAREAEYGVRIHAVAIFYDRQAPVGVGDSAGVRVVPVQFDVGRRHALSRRRVSVKPVRCPTGDEESSVGVGNSAGLARRVQFEVSRREPFARRRVGKNLVVPVVDHKEPSVGVGDSAGVRVVVAQLEIGLRKANARRGVGVNPAACDDKEPVAGVGDAGGEWVAVVQKIEIRLRNGNSRCRIGIDLVVVVGRVIEDEVPAAGVGDAGG